MGSGTWSTTQYEQDALDRSQRGQSTFSYSDQVRTRPASQQKAHNAMNVFGVQHRESCDSAEHPNSVAIAVHFDVTGSMGEIPMTLQTRMSDLFGLILRKGYVADPQIMFGGIGDHTCDNVPVQIGQFESDNRTDESLRDIYLEGGGGGQGTESYELAMYFMARHTKIDCLNKRGHKGYLFLVADELPHGTVSKAAVATYFGDKLEKDIPLETIVRELMEMYEVYILFPSSGSGYSDDTSHHNAWKKLFPERFVMFNPEDICEVIVSIIGKREGTFDAPEILAHLKELGTSAKSLMSISQVLETVTPGASASIASAQLPGLSGKKSSGTRRL